MPQKMSKKAKQGSSTAKAPDMFTSFKDLPAELRIMIWKICIPRRVVAIDCAKRKDRNSHVEIDKPPRYPPPIITRVCHESRQVVLDEGGKMISHECSERQSFLSLETVLDMSDPSTWMPSVDSGSCPGPHRPLWINPKYDTLYTASSRLFMRDDGKVEARLPLPRNTNIACERLMLWDTPMIGLASEPETSKCQPKYWPQVVLPEMSECIATVVFSAPKQDILDSGLIGLTGEETVVLVDLEDKARLKRFEKFWKGPKSNAKGDGFLMDYEGALNKVDKLAYMILLHSSISQIPLTYELAPSDPPYAVYAKQEEEKRKTKEQKAKKRRNKPAGQDEDTTQKKMERWMKLFRPRLPHLRPVVMFRYGGEKIDMREKDGEIWSPPVPWEAFGTGGNPREQA